MALMMLLKKRPKKSVVPSSGNKRKTAGKSMAQRVLILYRQSNVNFLWSALCATLDSYNFLLNLIFLILNRIVRN
jgi:hypothetical protein